MTPGSSATVDNEVLQSEELEAIEAIYGEDCKVNRELGHCQVFVPNAAATPQIVLETQFVPSYPCDEAPWVELRASHLPQSVRDWAITQLKAQFLPGEGTIYSWAEWLREQTDLWSPLPETEYAVEEPHEDEQLKQEEPIVEDVKLSQEECQNSQYLEELRTKIVHGEPLLVKKSTFQGHMCPIMRPEEVPLFMSILLENKEIRNATHNILAYRIQDADRKTFYQDYDDDGETAAGGRLLHMLQAADVVNVAVVVTRWFGGTLLGPPRFMHINNAARNLLVDCGYIAKGGTGKKSKKKK